MKYTIDVIIDRPVNEVVEHFDDSDKLREWMDGLQRIEHLEGEPGEVGAKSKLYFDMGNRQIEMLETIKEKNLPEKFSGLYVADGVYNLNTMSFRETGANQTRLTLDAEFEFTHWVMKIMAFFGPSLFKKQSKKNLDGFKRFVESQ